LVSGDRHDDSISVKGECGQSQANDSEITIWTWIYTCTVNQLWVGFAYPAAKFDCPRLPANVISQHWRAPADVDDRNVCNCYLHAASNSWGPVISREKAREGRISKL
jgi:hypothetical protein